eukprot:scaffold985_cov145-Skeletonema_menzelii.AAC.11
MYNPGENYRRRNPTYDNRTSFLHEADEINGGDIGLETGANQSPRYASYASGAATSNKFTNGIVNRFASTKNKKRKNNKRTSSYAYGNDDDNFVTGIAGGNYDEEDLPSQRFGLMLVLGLLAAGGLTSIVTTIGGGSETALTMPNIPRALFDTFSYTAASLLPSRMPFFGGDATVESDEDDARPDFVYEHPYVSSSYYTSTKSVNTLISTEKFQVKRNLQRMAAEEAGDSSQREMKTRLAIVRPFCEFDAEALPTTFACWNGLTPCKAAQDAIGDDYDEDDEFEVGPNGEFIAYKNSTEGRNLYGELGDRHLFDFVGSDAMKSAKADVFLFYSQTFSENDVAIKAVDTIIDQFFEPGGWSQCFDNIYAIEANIPQELDLYIPSAQEELYNWVNGPNRQYEAAFRIIQSGEWGDYDGFYLMEGDSVPIKSHWLDVVLSEIEVNRPFAILGAQYDGDKWDNFYEQIPISLLHHTNGNAIYNTSHPLLERLVGQLEVEAPCPYNSIPYDYRMSQMWVEGTLGIVPELAPKIMLNEEGENITLSDNINMFKKWADIWEKENPFKYTPVIHNYAATNLIPRHLGPEYIIHGAKLYSPWDPTRTEVTLVVSEWFFDRSIHLIKNLDEKDHPFSEVVVMIPPAAIAHDDFDMMTEVPVRAQHRAAPDFMDLCEADIKTEWFMITNSYHQVSRHVDLMFTPGKFQPVIPFTPATYPFCFKFPYCKETVNLAQRFNPGHDKVVLDMDMLYHTESRNKFCKEWKEENGEEGEDLYKHHQRRLMFRKKIIGPPGPTGTSYFAYLVREGKDGMYKMTDRSLYGARPPFVKVFAKEEKLDGMSEDELAKRVGMTLLDNSTDCNCAAFESEADCEGSGLGCAWRALFESCHPPELIDGSEPICASTEAPTMSPTVSLEGVFDATESPTTSAESTSEEAEEMLTDEENPWFISMFKSREHEAATNNSTEEDSTLMGGDDDDAIMEPVGRALGLESLDSFYETNLSANERLGFTREIPPLVTEDLPAKQCDPWMPSIVPRKRTVSSMWDGASPDPESRTFSAPAVSRPRKLHSSFIQYQALISEANLPNSPDSKAALESIVDGSSARLENSWLTSAVPINAPKYAMGQSWHPSTKYVGLPAKIQKTLVDYGHENSFEPLRILFESDHLDDFGKQKRGKQSITATAILAAEALSGDILPAVSDIWANALSIVRATSNISPSSSSKAGDEKKCGEADVPRQHLLSGVPNSDIVIYVTPNGPQCYRDGGDTPSGLLSYSSVCSFDQNMRPIFANLVVCFNSIETSDGELSVTESLRLTASLTKEVGKVLGMSPSLYQYFRNVETGQPYGATMQEVTCVDGSKQTLSMPKVLEASFDSADDNNLLTQTPYYEIVTPTVRQVVRNHFDCQTLRGARLDRKGKASSCFGESFDPRYHFDEDFTPAGGSADMAHSLSPLTMALLEDSGWYRANFDLATTPLFGRGAGCGFVKDECTSNSEDVPEYSHGFFCKESNLGYHQPLGCDYTHNHKADCGAAPGIDGNCPMRKENLVSCVDQSNAPSLAGEMYSENSRCFETNINAVCLESYCNSVDNKLDIVIGGKVHQCDYEGQLVDVDMGYYVRCPRLAVVCPHLVCPANCSGKGVCDYCAEEPRCICDIVFDESEGCFGKESAKYRLR